MRIRFCTPLLKVTTSFLFALSFFSTSAIADQAEEDATCFPLYRQTGAIPGTGIQCNIQAAAASVGLATYFCTGSPDIIERYCGTVMVPGSCPSADVGNPIDSSIGNKKQSEVDYVGTGLLPLRLTRYYNSNTSHARGGSFGDVWRMSYDRSIIKPNSSLAYAARPDGKLYYFGLKSGVWASQNASIKDQLIQQKNSGGATTGWLYTSSADDSQEQYDASGRLIKIIARNGQTQTLTLSTANTPKTVASKAGLPVAVTDHFGRTLSFTYNSDDTIATMTDPAGGIYRYRYDPDKHLTKVEYPTDDASIQARTYLYNEPEHTAGQVTTNLLTGIQDEKGVRFATYDYDAESRGIATQHAGGVERVGLTYGTNQTVVTDSLGAQRTYSFERVAGALRLIGVNQPGGAGCAAAANKVTYDANGNLKTYRDFNGVTTIYQFDLARNLETKRTEASGTPEERVISTEWHPSFHLPARIAEPKRITTFAYYGDGSLQSKTIYTTNDVTGAQGFSASPSTASLKSTYTYDNVGRLLTSSEPAFNGMPQKMSTNAWVDGNLSSVTNGVGQITSFQDYDAHGRPGRMVESNGVITTYPAIPTIRPGYCERSPSLTAALLHMVMTMPNA